MMRSRIFFILFVATVLSGAPVPTHASVVWGSAAARTNDIHVFTPELTNRWFDGTASLPVAKLGVWDRPDFTATASTTVHIWSRWNGKYINLLATILRASSGGDPFYGSGKTNSQLIAPPGGYSYVFVDATSTLQEYTIPVNKGSVIRQGDELWAFISPSFSAYGANHWVGSNGTTPYLEICEGSCASSPPPPPDPCANGGCISSVLFLPGIETSRLYEDVPCANGVCETKLWEPGGDSTALQLAHDANGASVQPGVYAKSIIDNAYIPVKGNIYKSFIEQMDGLVAAGTMRAWEAIPYDWRLTPDQILESGTQIAPGKISYLAATSSPYIMQELRELAATSKSGKVTIVAHSNGGLIAKRLIEKLGPDAAKIVDKIVFVAVPQTGTPQAIGALLHGYDQGLPSSFISYGLSDSAARSLAKNMPMTYNLLPSSSYFTQVDTPVASFADQPLLAEFRARYGDLIHSSERLHSFVTDSWRTASSTTEGLTYPSVGNDLLLKNADALHADLDTWKPPTGITLYEIAGWGEKTLAGIDYYQGISVQCDQVVSVLSGCTKTSKIAYRPRIVLDGDGTVVTPSALWTQGAKRYWVDLYDYNGFFGITKHASILEVPQLRTFIQNIITNNGNVALPEYISTSTPVSTKSDTEFCFTLHSPLSLHLYDEQGRHTGISTTTGELEENIPGSRYMKFGEVQFISVPSSINTQLVMNGYASGSFTLDAEEVNGERVIASTTFAGIPSTAGTVATMSVSSGSISNLGALTVDENNDGHPDITLHAKEGGVVTLDTTPPVTTFSAQGVAGLHGWYTSDALVTLTATDTESGVASTSYSLDGGATWNVYTAPFTTSEGVTTISYYSTDAMGNAESVASTTIKIDKTAPEAKIVFATTTSEIVIVGTDALSPTSVSSRIVPPERNAKNKGEEKVTKTVAITDDAGNTTILSYIIPSSDAKRRTSATIVSVSYNSAATSSAKASAQYKWALNKRGEYTSFAAYLKTASSTLETHYQPKKNITTIMLKPQELDDREDDRDFDSRPIRSSFPGLLLPGLQTEKGSVKVIY